MTVTAHNLGFPRIGARRELKRALEAYWKGELDRDALMQVGRELRLRHWRVQAEAGVSRVPVGDFSWYDHVLDTSALLGAVPARFGRPDGAVDIDTYFRMARGRAPVGDDAPACEMTKWFDTNYHYLVPELHRGQRFHLASDALFDQVEECRAAGFQPKPVLVGPLTWLWLGKVKGEDFDRLELLDGIIEVYREVLHRLQGQGVEWVQIDEPILVLDLPVAWRACFEPVYHRLQGGPKLLLATCFGALEENLSLAARLPTAGLHLDLVRGPDQLPAVLDWLAPYKVLSLGAIDGRNVWRSDLDALFERLQPVHERLGDRLWIAPSCSLLHVPVDLEQEDALDGELKSWLAFATQKLDELHVLACALNEGPDAVADALADNRAVLKSRRHSPRLHDAAVRERLAALTPAMARRHSAWPVRDAAQRAVLDLPLFPTTTIGSFPQTADIRRARRDYKAGHMTAQDYRAAMQAEIGHVVERQEALDLDVLVHGEAERNDMVEYFGEQLAGFAFTDYGWVQSYGSRCVKPPII
ncbi:MAG: 5-methyltetrahydropteroyltriglutamate--homocysteine S-methyltransferase, partial [Chromatiales bacterium]|nr:5-methyltetrahydropteroyltriglutamate--homocysteine S-methyltransferase [Chromatiales bacterium]